MSSRWLSVPLSEISTPIQRPIKVEPGKSYRTIGVKLWGEGAYERQTIDGSQTAAKVLSVVEDGDLIINKIWVRHGSAAIASEAVAGCAASNEFPTFALDEKRVKHRWIHWLTKIKWFWCQCDALSMGTSGKNRIKPERFLTIAIPLPPIAEQQRVVERIDALAAMIEEAKELREVAKQKVVELTAQMLVSAVAQGQWPLLSIEELVGRSNLKNGKSLKVTSLPSEIQCLTLSSMRDGRINTGERKSIPMSLSEAKPYLVRRGDIFVVRGNGSKHLVGRAGLVDKVDQSVIYPDLFIKIPVDEKKLLPKYFVAIWNSRPIRAQIEDSAKTTSGIWKVNQGHIASIAIPVPPLEEQTVIVKQIEEMDVKFQSLISIQSSTSRELVALFPAILDRAFKGELL